MKSGQSTACVEAFARRFAENEEHVLLTGTYVMDEFHYGSVRKALAFWKTIRERRSKEDEDELWAVLRQYSAHRNIFVRAVAKLESLPTRVFRRVLWFYNIDYQSLESCLRRLTLEQISSISETYEDLYGSKPKVPRCFTEGVYNKVQQCLPWARVAVEDLLNEEGEDNSPRLETKGAIAHNFFEWDMGFHQYPKEETDEILADTAADTFFSLTDKITEETEEKVFEINKEEGGTYWWLNKTCRSNYLWNRDETAMFNKKVCPAFWYTIAAWIIFLFLSPLAFYISVFGAHHGTYWHSYLRDALGLVTPGIFLAAAFKYVFLGVGEALCIGVDWIEDRFEEVKIDKEYWKEFLELVCGFLVYVVVALVTCAIWKGLHMFFLGSIFFATLITTFLVFYVFHIMYYKKGIWPTSLPLVGKPLVLFVVLKVLYDYHRNILDFLIWTKQLLAAVLIAIGENIPLVIIGVSVLSFGITWKFASNSINHTVEDYYYFKPEAEAQMEKLYAVAMYVTWVFVFLYLVGIAYFFWTTGDSLRQAGTSFATILIILLSVSVFAIQFFMVNDLKPRGILNQKKIMVKGRDYSTRKEGFYKLMAKNKWVRTLEAPLPAVGKLWKFADRFLRVEDYRELLCIDKEGFNLLDTYSKGLGRYHGFNPRDIVLFMVDGKPFKKAIKILTEEKERKQNFRRRLVRVYDLTLGRIMRPLQRVWNWFWMMIDSAQRIWKEFNEMCPLETPTKEIK